MSVASLIALVEFDIFTRFKALAAVTAEPLAQPKVESRAHIASYPWLSVDSPEVLISIRVHTGLSFLTLIKAVYQF
jgi:hypothetical protein